MRFHKDEFRVSPEVRYRLIADVLRPHLADCEAELGFALPTELLCCAGPIEERKGVLTGSSGVTSEPASGTARLRVRQTFRADRFVYRIEAIYRLSHPSGFSGFYLSGDLVQSSAGIAIKQAGFTVHYNNHERRGWF